jgi:hypothetical protein
MQPKKTVIIKGPSISIIHPKPSVRENKELNTWTAYWENSKENGGDVFELTRKTREEAIFFWYKKFMKGGG